MSITHQLSLACSSTKCILCTLYRVLREQWIRAKYERMEFTEEKTQRPYTAGNPFQFPDVFF